MFFYDSTWLILIPGILLAIWAQSRVNSAYREYARVPSAYGRTGAQVAREILDHEGMSDVAIERIEGTLSDHYDPAHQVLRLSSGVYDSTSLAALGVAAHESGHALQHRDGYAPLMLRNIAVPTVSIGSNLSWPIFIVGLILSFEPLVWAGILLFAFVVLFSLVTLPVEFNASSRAMLALEGSYITQSESTGVRKVLNAAAMTYVASAVSAILQLLRLIMISGVGRRRD